MLEIKAKCSGYRRRCHFVSAFLTTSTKLQRIRESFDISALPEDAMQEIRDRIITNVRFNTVVQTGVPGFIPGPR
jgi:hypothetical protein